jgi:hypothetical protein
MISRVMVLSPTPVGPPIMMSVLIFFLRITNFYEFTNLQIYESATNLRIVITKLRIFTCLDLRVGQGGRIYESTKKVNLSFRACREICLNGLTDSSLRHGSSRHCSRQAGQAIKSE